MWCSFQVGVLLCIVTIWDSDGIVPASAVLTAVETRERDCARWCVWGSGCLTVVAVAVVLGWASSSSIELRLSRRGSEERLPESSPELYPEMSDSIPESVSLTGKFTTTLRGWMCRNEVLIVMLPRSADKRCVRLWILNFEAMRCELTSAKCLEVVADWETRWLSCVVVLCIVLGLSVSFSLQASWIPDSVLSELCASGLSALIPRSWQFVVWELSPLLPTPQGASDLVTLTLTPSTSNTLELLYQS